jgi:Fe-S-cluster formation regulator IscX/YfhJ
MGDWELDEPSDEAFEERMDAIPELDNKYVSVREDIDKATIKLEELAQKVVRLATMLDDHMKEADAHHPAMLSKKK